MFISYRVKLITFTQGTEENLISISLRHFLPDTLLHISIGVLSCERGKHGTCMEAFFLANDFRIWGKVRVFIDIDNCHRHSRCRLGWVLNSLANGTWFSAATVRTNILFVSKSIGWKRKKKRKPYFCRNKNICSCHSSVFESCFQNISFTLQCGTAFFPSF